MTSSTDRVTYKQQTVISSSSGGRESEIRVPANVVSAGDTLPGLLTVASHDGRGEGAIAGPLHRSTARNTNPVLEGSTSTPLRTGPPF